MGTSLRILLTGLVAVGLHAPLTGFAQQQLAPSPPPPSRMVSEPLGQAPVTVPQVLEPQPISLAPAPRESGTSAQQAAPATTALKSDHADQARSPLTPSMQARAQPLDTAAAYACPADLAAQCKAARLAEIAYATHYYESLTQELQLRRRAFEWHEFSTKALFWGVIAITAMGLVLSWREFGKYYGARHPGIAATPAVPDASATQEAAAQGPPQSVFKVSAQGLEVTSSLIGFLVLSVSLVFFYLYVVNVYPLHELANVQTTAGSAAPADKK
jgi:hypothetical protein